MFEWDEQKAESNAAKHGVAFDAINGFEFDTAVTIPHVVDGETRYRSIGYIGTRLCVAVWTRRGESRRLISLRKANKREERFYAQA